ncbi:MAG: hypothetical protein H6732_13720 [Alphaproteobacteria bacterium]|nr:hypothetical protein [Alphaproteobacteria bacterium]
MVAWWLLVGAVHAACPEVELPALLQVDPGRGDDVEEPSGPTVSDVRFELLPAQDGCEDCGEVFVLELDLEPGPDADSPDGAVGVQAALLHGVLPTGVSFPDQPFLGPTARFVWPVDGREFLAEIDLVIELRSVDRAGNRSGESLEVTITRDALPEVLSGCAHGGRGLPLLLALGALAARRRTR